MKHQFDQVDMSEALDFWQIWWHCKLCNKWLLYIEYVLEVQECSGRK